uniref:Predicted protein n=1 Tax=Hordeum vulgare subsp. vulgare TaxID=112509 RepID=F2D2F6_HORVV|nr:predicted protein [Hordeum vulgare subsp. vulgare]
MPAPTYLSPPSFHNAVTATATTSAHLLSGGRNRNRRSRPRRMSGPVLLKAQAGDGDGDGGDEQELLLASRRHAVLGVARVLFAAANDRCMRCMNQAALGRSATGTFCGDLLVGAMANSWRVLMQGLASLMFLCARADEYVRPPPSPLVLTPHDKPAAHPQQVIIKGGKIPLNNTQECA